jgi:hypothetical protein
MIEKDVLFTLAEIAIALAGFSAIIGVLGGRRGSSDNRVNSLRLQVMLETCFMVAAASFLPVILDQFDMAPAALWRTASAVFLCVAIPFELVARNRTRGMLNMTLTKININTVNWGISIASDLILVAILLSLVGPYSEAFYLVTLLLQLVVAGIIFVQFAADTFTYTDEDQQ